ncbi:glycosyltransferase family A protein [Maribacter sp. 2210JD10-5]|uniref:glycosyltransferase family A protein n=1 Tax=Maribacter sp. 2210JD10-5 TaxID=3386272 RepID=UPI0039BC3435
MKIIKELPISLFTRCLLTLMPLSKLKRVKSTQVPVIVSLTSIPSRIRTLHLVIRSLLNQDTSPKKIVLWLNENLKPVIPKKLKKLEGDLFEIKYSQLTCSHRKLIHSLQEFPNEIIVTCDDDLMYRRNWISLLYKEHQKFPENIIANQTSHINFDDSNKPLPFKKWRKEFINKFNPKALVPIGAWGILYPPNSLHQETTNIILFLKYAPKADDLWFKAMAILNNTISRQAENVPKEPIPIGGTQKIALKRDNLGLDKNTLQWAKLEEKYSLSALILNED